MPLARNEDSTPDEAPYPLLMVRVHPLFLCTTTSPEAHSYFTVRLKRPRKLLTESIDFFQSVLEMRGNRCCQLIGLCHLVFGIVACVSKPSNIQIVIPGSDLFALKEPKPPLFPFILPFCL